METEILESKKNFLGDQYQTLNTIISSGGSKEFLGRDVSLKELDAMDEDKLEAYYKIYELNRASKIGENIVKGAIAVYSIFVNKVLPIDDVEKLKEDLNNDYILTSVLKNIAGSIAELPTCEKLMSAFSLGFITFNHIKPQAKEPCKDNESTLESTLERQ